MPINTTIKIEVAGETLSSFSELHINQKANAHHNFTISRLLSQEFVGDAMDTSQQYIGQPIRITIDPKNMKTDSSFIFYGIVSDARMIRTAGAAGMLFIEGFSPSILMDAMPTAKSFTDKSFADIIQEVSLNYSQQQLKPNIDIQNDTSTLPYTVQYGESDFAFLSRMAQKKGEWFYYNGEETYFGKPQSKTITLEYGRSLHKFDIEMHARPLNFQYTGYDPSSSDTQRASSSEINYEPRGYGKSVFDASKKMYPNVSNSLYSNPLEEAGARTHLVNRATTQLHSRSANLVIAKGESDETGIRIGDIVIINESSFSSTGNALDGVKEQNFGSYIITSIIHSCDSSGVYYNYFEAVPDTVLSPPYGNALAIPFSEIQTAIVTDNNDPKGLGRVQVQMAWQNDTNTPWLRMTNPHAGGGKGMYFIPEIGEEVLVGFENSNAEKPFVLGAMYNGNESSGYHTSGNDKKVIQSRSGTKVIMDDAQGSVFIEDPSGNTWLMDGAGNISVNAPKNFTVNAGENIVYNAGGNIVVSAQKNINIVASESITETANEDYSLTATNINETAMQSRSSKATSITENMDKGQFLSTKDSITLESAKEVFNNSGKKVKMQ